MEIPERTEDSRERNKAADGDPERELCRLF